MRVNFIELYVLSFCNVACITSLVKIDITWELIFIKVTDFKYETTFNQLGYYQY